MAKPRAPCVSQLPREVQIRDQCCAGTNRARCATFVVATTKSAGGTPTEKGLRGENHVNVERVRVRRGPTLLPRLRPKLRCNAEIGCVEMQVTPRRGLKGIELCNGAALVQPEQFAADLVIHYFRHDHPRAGREVTFEPFPALVSLMVAQLLKDQPQWA
jgi:hypothetical protein